MPVKSDRVALDAESSEHCAERPIQIEKDRTLLDMQFEISGRVRQLLPALHHVLKLDSIFRQRRRQADALSVFQRARLSHIEVT